MLSAYVLIHTEVGKAGQVAELVEKVLPLPFDVLVHAWFDLAADAPPAVLHREFFHATGAFRAGPPIAEFQELIGRFAVATDPGTLGELTADIDRFVYQQALCVFLCAPQALYAVNRHVAFDGYAATFEQAETQASPQHWSRRSALCASRRCGLVDAVLLPPGAARPSSVEAKT
jgi:peptide/nickel transport system substrate-binding protein